MNNVPVHVFILEQLFCLEKLNVFCMYPTSLLRAKKMFSVKDVILKELRFDMDVLELDFNANVRIE